MFSQEYKHSRLLHFFFFCLFRAAPEVYGGSQARYLIGAVAAGLCHSHSNADLSHVCDLHHSSWQCQILNLLSHQGTPLYKYFRNHSSHQYLQFHYRSAEFFSGLLLFYICMSLLSQWEPWLSAISIHLLIFKALFFNLSYIAPHIENSLKKIVKNEKLWKIFFFQH